MDYETADGSLFSLREIWAEQDEDSGFLYTTVTAIVDGKAYAGRIEKPVSEVDDVEIMGSLQVVPTENIYPIFPHEYTLAPESKSVEYYLKAPSFSYDDSRPGNTFVADCFLNEATVLERLSKHAHPNIVQYFGCVIRDERITYLCLERQASSLVEYAETERTDDEKDRLLGGIEAAVKHIHSLGLAHNDINPDNVCVDANGNAVLVDFDSCLPFGANLQKGIAATSGPQPQSCPENDLRGIEHIEDW